MTILVEVTPIRELNDKSDSLKRKNLHLCRLNRFREPAC